jgi:SAM-dependent methyltransferase
MPVDGARTFGVPGEGYDAFMGRYSVGLAAPFADTVDLTPDSTVLDIGCGPGALTAELVSRVGAGRVRACDPSPPFAEACAQRCPGVDVRLGPAEALPFDDGSCDVALAQLVLHFVGDPAAAMREIRRTVRPGGQVAACVWEFGDGMEMLRHFWRAARSVDPDAPDEAERMRFGRPGEIAALFTDAGCTDVRETRLATSSTYRDLDELWDGLLLGIGPAGSYLVGLPSAARDAVRAALVRELGAPEGAFTLGAVAWAAAARLPG